MKRRKEERRERRKKETEGEDKNKRSHCTIILHVIIDNLRRANSLARQSAWESVPTQKQWPRTQSIQSLHTTGT